MSGADPGMPPASRSRFFFPAVILLLVAGYAIYLVNLIAWRNSPNFGWRTTYDSGPNFVAQTFRAAEAAGLRVGDTILSINGIPYSTFEELYHKVRNGETGSVNVYTVLRDGKELEVRITTERLGVSAVLWRSGLPYGMGLVYVLIGVLVNLMKPAAAESRIFFLMIVIIGMQISFSAPSDLFRPIWFFNVRTFLISFLPAPMIHLALRFPKTHAILRKKPGSWVVPYLASLLLFFLYMLMSPDYWTSPPVLDHIFYGYLILSVLVFLGSTAWNMARDPSVVVRLQSRVIFVGILIGFVIPLADMLLRFFLKLYIFPSPTVGYTLVLLAFPLSIGYTIVKHDLFAIDVIVRRTYGYMVSTASIIGAYALVISALNIIFRSTEVSRSPVFSIAFALGAVFFFRPLHERIQRFVDRVFYRQRYDYRKTIQAISEAMTSVLDPKEIQRMLVGSVVKEMFLENGVLALQAAAGASYRVEFAEGFEDGSEGRGEFPADSTILKHLRGRSEPVFRYDVELDPAFGGDRESLQQTFRAFASEVMLPLRYKDRLRGVLSLGRKKSGKIFTREDVDLLKTISSQGAIALENAHLFEENLEKGRMEEELKIAHDIQVSMLPERAPEIEGLRIAARSIPAREVGGDFYDFVTMVGEDAGGKVAIVVGDVSGKAVSGALVMAASRSVFRVLTETNASVGEVMDRMNVRLHRDVRKGMFVAALYALLDSRERTLTLANAGQTSPVLCPADGGPPVLIENEGDRFPLGIVAECSYEEIRVPLNPGDIVVLYTDGGVEAVNAAGEMYGFDRFLETVGRGRGLSADALLELLLEDVARFVGGGEPHDDITIVVAKVQ